MITKLGVQSVHAASRGGFWASEAGKRRRLSRLADAEGRFAMLAVDQRTSLKNVLDDHLDADEQKRALQAVKRVVTRHIGPLGTALLTDPIYGYPHTLDAIPPCTGLMLAVEVSGYETAGEHERRSRLLEDFDVSTAAAAGADGVKLLIWHHPDASTETQHHQRHVVRRIGDDCRKAGLPFILEIVTYGLESSRSAPHFVRRKPELVLDGVRTYSAAEYGVDLFKVQFPADLKYTAEYQAASYAKGTVFFEKPQVEALCREIDEAASAPWVILSAGVDPDEFIENVKIANAAGASGFLCGRAVWKNVVHYLPDERSMEDFIKEVGCAHFRRIREANAGAHPWNGRNRFAAKPSQ